MYYAFIKKKIKIHQSRFVFSKIVSTFVEARTFLGGFAANGAAEH